MFEMDGIRLSFDEQALDYIVDKAIEFRLGARGLRSICEAVMMDAMYELPSKNQKEFHVSADYAQRKIDKSKIYNLKAS